MWGGGRVWCVCAGRNIPITELAAWNEISNEGAPPASAAAVASPLCTALTRARARFARRFGHSPHRSACAADAAADSAQAAQDGAEEPFNDPLGDSEFVRWYRFEKAKEQYEKDNPRDVVGEAAAKLAGPLSSLAILGAG